MFIFIDMDEEINSPIIFSVNNIKRALQLSHDIIVQKHKAATATWRH